MELFSSIRALASMRDSGETISLNLRGQPTLNTPSVPLGGVGFEWAYEMGGGNSTVSGEAINTEIALRISTVYSCIRVLAYSISVLPLVLREQTKEGSTEAINHALHYILGTEPNVEMGRVRFWNAIVMALMADGNAYCQIVRNKAGQVAELYPLLPALTEPYRLTNGTLAFRTQQGQQNGNWKTLNASDVCHFALMSMDGGRGMSPIRQAREALGLARAAEKAGAKLFGNGARPGGILVGPPNITPEQKAQSRESWQAAHGGSNQGGTAVLSGDWKYQPLTLSPEDAQFIQTRMMQRTEICALYGVPPNMAGDTTRLSNGNWENINLSFVVDTLKPIIAILQDELNRKLMPQMGRKAGAYYAQFDLSQRMVGDFETQMKGYGLGRQWGWFSANDIRRKIGENTIDDPAADVYIYPVNMANAEQLPDQADEENINEPPETDPEQDPNGDETDPKPA
jgi:HK97 family phage portal protein